MTEGYGAVLVGQPAEAPQWEVAGAVFSPGTGGRIAKVDDPRFVVLAHPLEARILAQTGYTHDDLLWQGRYVGVTNVSCRECGEIFCHRKLKAPGGIGCSAVLWSSLATGVIAGIIARGFFIGLLAAVAVLWLGFAVIDFLTTRYLRRHFRDRMDVLAAERRCPRCTADNAVPIGKNQWLKCSACGSKTLKFYTAGKS